MKNNIKNLIPAYILAFVVSFMLYIYEPILIYSSNFNDFWFDFKAMMGVIPIYFAILFVGLSIGYTALYFINKAFSKKIQIYKVVLIISYVLFMFVYIQGNYLAGELPTLDGTTINWSDYTTQNIISLVVLAVLTIAEVVAIIKLKYEKVEKANNYITIAIFVMLLTSLISVMFTPGLYREKIVANSTTRNINSASSDKNFFIFLVDAVDSTEFAKAVKESEKYKSTFEDFTYYPDTVSAYLYTRDSIPFIFSGEWNENETEFVDYYNDAFNNSKLLKELNEQNYQMNFYEYQIQASSRKLEDFANIDIYNKEVNTTSFFKQLTKYVLFKYLPYSLKPYSHIETMNFEYAKVVEETEQFNWSNDIAYHLIKNNEIEKIDNKYFQFLHIEGAHTPFNYDENVNKIPETEGTYQLKIKATLNIVDTFINRLKENNVYDNSVIMVMADHGYWATTDRHNPILYIKGINEHHEMVTSDIPVSYEDLIPAYLQLLDGQTSDKLFQNIDPNRVRRFIENAFEGEDNMIEYEVRGKAWDSAAIVKTGREFNR